MHSRHQILWYRPGDGKPREVVLSPMMLKLLVGVPFVVLVFFVVGVVLFASVGIRAREVEDLQAENARLRAEMGRIAVLESRLSELLKFSEQVKRSLTEGADLERIIEAGKSVGQEVPSVTRSGAWVPVEPSDSGGHSFFDPEELGGRESAPSFPETWPVEGFVTRGFERSVVDPANSHIGIDIAAPRGTPVRVVADGDVIVADWNPRYGHRVIVDHGGEVLSIYGHNEILFVRPGDRVRSGQPIALSGNSGISSAPHLHFELWVNGRPKDPKGFLPREGAEDGAS